MTPKTLSQLLKVSAPLLWKGKAYEMTAYRNVEEFIEIVGDLKLSEVKTTTLDDWRRVQWSKVSLSTINRKLVNIKQVLAFAVDREWMEKTPKARFEKEPEGRIRWLTSTEEALMFSLLNQWGEHEAARYIRAALETGLRRGELLAVKPQDIDNGYIRLWKTKTKTARSVPLTEGAQEALKGFSGWSLDAGKLRSVWTRLRIAMGLQHDPDFVLHCLRHTTATRLLAKTGNVAYVQKMLGHRKITTTMRYAHVSDEDLKRAVTK